MIDIGANLTNKAFSSDLSDVLARAQAAGVSAIVVTGTSVEASKRARDIANEHDTPGLRLYATAGVHPHHAATAGPPGEIEELLRDPHVVAVGECGLDFERNYSPRDAQLRVFEEQLAIAGATGKPLFLHERRAHRELADIVARRRPRLGRAVVHCFTGTRDELVRYLDLDLFIGITGWICDERRGAHLKEIVGLVPKGRLMIETDAPYLLPRDLPDPPKSRRNEPAFLGHVARAIAQARGESFEELLRHTTDATKEFFAIA